MQVTLLPTLRNLCQAHLLHAKYWHESCIYYGCKKHFIRQPENANNENRRSTKIKNRTVQLTKLLSTGTKLSMPIPPPFGAVFLWALFMADGTAAGLIERLPAAG
jgi:hypothetical protein